MKSFRKMMMKNVAEIAIMRGTCYWVIYKNINIIVLLEKQKVNGMNANSRSKSPQPSGSLLKSDKANITKLRNKLSEIFQRCSNR